MARSKQAAQRRRIHGRSRPIAESSQNPCHAGANHTRVQVLAVWRQEQEPASGFAHGFGCSGILVRREVVQDHDGARLQFRDQHLLDISRKGFAIHRPLNDPRGDQRIGAKACDEGLCAP